MSVIIPIIFSYQKPRFIVHAGTLIGIGHAYYEADYIYAKMDLPSGPTVVDGVLRSTRENRERIKA